MGHIELPDFERDFALRWTVLAFAFAAMYTAGAIFFDSWLLTGMAALQALWGFAEIGVRIYVRRLRRQLEELDGRNERGGIAE